MNLHKTLVLKIIKYPIFSFMSCLLGVGLLATGIKHLHGSYEIRSWFQVDDPDIIKLNSFEKKFGFEESLVIAIHNPKGIFNSKTSQKIYKITERLKNLDQINRVESLSNFPIIESNHDEITTIEFLEPPFETVNYLQKLDQAQKEIDLIGYLLTEDTKTSLVFAYTTSQQTNTEHTKKLTKEAKSIIKEFEGDGDILYLSGTLPVTDAYREASTNDFIYLGPLALMVMFVAFVIIFKNPVFFIYPLIVMILSILATYGLAGFLGFTFNNMTAALPVVLITICMSDCVHILNWTRSESKENLLYNSLTVNFTATLLTSVTTAIGFFTFGLSVIPPVAQFGILGGFGTSLAWVLTYMLAPVCFYVLDKPLKKLKVTQNNTFFVQKLHKFLVERNFAILMTFGSLSFVFLILSCFNTINSDLDDYFSKDFWALKSVQFIKKQIGGVSGPEVVVYAKDDEGVKSPDFLKQVDQFQSRIEELNMVTRTYSVVNSIKKMNQVLNSNKPESYVIPETQNSIAELLLLYSFNLPPGQSINHLYSVDNKSLKISVLQNSTSSEKGIELMNEITELGQEMNLHLSLEGNFSLIKRLSRMIVSTMLSSLWSSILFVTLILVIFLKGPKIFYFSLLPNLVPLSIAGGILYLTHTPVDMGIMVVFSICFGIAADDTIHFFVRYSHYHQQGLNTSDNVYKILEKTGTSLIYTSVILIFGFLTFGFADFLPNKNFGVFSAVVIVFALLADILMLPALFLYFDRKKS